MSEAVRDHYLYHNVTPQADGLYHCPWETDPDSDCQHEPKKLKCHYDLLVDSHLQIYKCKVILCREKPFSSNANLLRHEREGHGMHGHGDKPFLCTYDRCERGISGNGFPRDWNLQDHMKRVHLDPGQPKSRASGSTPGPQKCKKCNASNASTPKERKPTSKRTKIVRQRKRGLRSKDERIGDEVINVSGYALPVLNNEHGDQPPTPTAMEQQILQAPTDHEAFEAYGQCC